MGSTRLSRRDLLAQAGSLAALGCIGGPAEAAAVQTPGGLPKGVTPFRIEIPKARIDRIIAQLGDVEWPDAPEDADPWAYGTSLAVMKDLVQHWRTQVRLEGQAGAHEPAATVQGARRGLRHPLRARARLRPEPAADRLQPRVAEHVPGVCEGRRAAGASRKARRPGRRRLLGRRPVASRLCVLVQTAQADRRADDGAALGPVDDRRPRLSRLHRAGRRPRIHHFPRDRLSGRELPRDPPQPPARHRRTVSHRPRRRRRKRSARTGRKSRAPTWRSSARSR